MPFPEPFPVTAEPHEDEGPIRTLIVLGHPGHELACFHFAQQNQCHFFCASDGGGSNGRSRHRICNEAMIEAGLTGFSNLDSIESESDLFSSILHGETDKWVRLIRNIRRTAAETKAELILCDRYEGYNPIHDLTAFCVSAAQLRLPLATIPLTSESAGGKQLGEEDLIAVVTEEMIRSKRNYAAGLSHLIPEIPREEDELLDYAKAPERFEKEPLGELRFERFNYSVRPFYEAHGDRRVAEGKYRHRIGFEDHIKPLMRRILAEIGSEH